MHMQSMHMHFTPLIAGRTLSLCLRVLSLLQRQQRTQDASCGVSGGGGKGSVGAATAQSRQDCCSPSACAAEASVR